MDRRPRLDQAQDAITRLARQGLDVVRFWRAVSPVLADAVPHHLGPCCYTLDPASRLITSHFQEGLPTFPAEWVAAEYAEDDVLRLADVARSPRGVSTLFEVTGGRPQRSARWHANMAYGGDQEMIAALRTRTGETWGAIGLYREAGRPLFDEAEQAFLRVLSPVLAEALRRGLLVGEATDPEGPSAPGMIVLDGSWQVETMSPGTQEWLADLPGGATADQLPPAVLAVAGRVSRSVTEQDTTAVVLSRVLTRSGHWVVLHGLPLAAGTTRRVAVIVEPAHPDRIAPLLMAAYGLTEREQQVTRLVLQGWSTVDIAAQLVISSHTVQEHLKKVFDKTGVRARRDLVTKIYFTHYEPRLRDNERRAAADRPVRGGPARTGVGPADGRLSAKAPWPGGGPDR